MLKLSNQAVGAVMMALQKSFQAVLNNAEPEECDVTNILKSFELEQDQNGLLNVLNPPVVNMEEVMQHVEFEDPVLKAGVKAPDDVQYEFTNGMMLPKN